MSTFQNVTDGDLDLQIDGIAVHVPAGGSFTLPNDYDEQVSEQPYYKHLTVKDAKAADPIIPPIDPPAPLEAPEPDPTTEPEPEAPATTEGDN
jgi:hypothetical protein